MRNTEEATLGIAVFAVVHHVDAAASAICRGVLSLGITCCDEETGNYGWLVAVVGVDLCYAHLEGQHMGGIVVAGGVLWIDNQLLARLVVGADVAHQSRLILHLIFMSARREIVLDGFVSCKTSIHGNARRENEASLRCLVDVTGNVLIAFHPDFVASLGLAQRFCQGDSILPRQTVVAGGRYLGICFHMIGLALC